MTQQPMRILIVEDSPSDLELVTNHLTRDGINFIAEVVETAEAFENGLHNFKPDIILSDYMLPLLNGADAFFMKRKMAPEVPFLIVSGVVGEERAVELIKFGVTDYVLKDKLYSLVPKIKRALQEARELKAKQKTERELIISEARLTRAQEIAHLGSWEMDIATGISVWSDEACRIYGLSPQQNTHTFAQWLGFIHPDDVTDVVKAVQESEKIMEGVKLYHRIIRPGGEIRNVYTESKFLFNETGTAVAIHGIAHDVTERIQTEQKLQQTERTLQDIFDNTLESIHTIDVDMRLTSYNNAFADSFYHYFRRAPRPGENLVELLPPDMRAGAISTNRRALDGERFVVEQEYDLNGIKQWYSISYSPITRNGEIVGVGNFSTNTTKQKHAEILMHKSFEELKAAAEKQSVILNALPANVLLLDKNGVVINVNDGWRKFIAKVNTGHANACLGESYFDLINRAININPDTRQYICQGLNDILNGNKELFLLDYCCHLPAGEIWFSSKMIPLEEHGDLGVVIMHVDITGRKNAEQEVINLNTSLEKKVAQRTADLEKANQEMEAFGYTVSHDLRAPVKVINGYASILESKYKTALPEEALTLLSGIKTNTRQMAQLIEDLLNFSHLGRAELVKKEINMNVLVSVVISELKLRDENFHAQINVTGLKPAVADAGLIHQVWTNLVGNAIKYSGKKTNPVIEIGMLQTGNKDVYYVKDNGAGFDMQNYDKLFTVFHRLHKPSEFEGTGVGLALVSSIIARHGGRIWAESALNQGAVFYFTLSGCPAETTSTLPLIEHNS